MGLAHIVVTAVPMTDWTTTERARRKCLERLLPVLEDEYDVERFVLESRGRDKDKKDIQLVDALHGRKYIDGIRVDHILRNESHLPLGGKEVRAGNPEYLGPQPSRHLPSHKTEHARPSGLFGCVGTAGRPSSLAGSQARRWGF